MSDQKITVDTNIAELLKKQPQAAKILMDEGIGCLGCAIAHQETIRQGLSAHGKTPEEIARIVKKINELG